MSTGCSDLAVICRIYAHALLVLDDADFHERQDVFTLSQQRGIATALNALVFRTHFPGTPGMQTILPNASFPRSQHGS